MLTTTRSTPRIARGAARRSGEARLRQHWGDWVRRSWAEVAIRHAEVRPLPQEDRIGSCIVAYVHLGELTPADVEVSVTRTSSAPADARNVGYPLADPFVATWPMFSVASLHNGEYQFEAHTPLPFDHAPGSGELIVHVEPARTVADPRPTPVRRALSTRSA